MPEGDTIYRAAANLRKALQGRVITSFETGYAQLARVDDDTPIAGRDNIPIVSWLLLRGKCRHCGEPISVQYPLVELLTGVLFAAVGAKYAHSWALPAFLVPFVFTLDSEGLGVLLQASPSTILWTSTSAAIGVCALAVGAGGWILRKATTLERVLAAAGGDRFHARAPLSTRRHRPDRVAPNRFVPAARP